MSPHSSILNWLSTLFWNGHERRLRALWRILAQQVAWGTIAILLLVSAKWAVLVAGGSEFGQADGPWISLEVAGTLLSVWWAAVVLDHRPFADYGLHLSKGWCLDFCFGLLLAAILWTALFLGTVSAGWVKVTGHFVTRKPEAGWLLAIASQGAILLLMAVREELQCRGYQLTNLAEGLRLKRVGRGFAIAMASLISSAVFGLMHAGNANATAMSTLNASLGGILLSLGYVLTGELAIPIGFHFSWNFLQGNVFGFTVSGDYQPWASFLVTERTGPPLWVGDRFGPESGLLANLAVLLGGLAIVLWVRLRQGHIGLSRGIAGAWENSKPDASGLCPPGGSGGTIRD
jgi:uncharacterized protein